MTVNFPNIVVSEDGQIVTIFGVRYDIELFRHLGIGPIGSRLEILARDDGTITLRKLPVEAARNPEIAEALKASIRALDDWLNTYASEYCDEARVKEAYDRIGMYGTVGYIAMVQEGNRNALRMLESHVIPERAE